MNDKVVIRRRVGTLAFLSVFWFHNSTYLAGSRMRNFLKASAAVAIILGLAVFNWRHLSGSVSDIESAVKWPTSVGKLEPGRPTEEQPGAVVHTVFKRVGMLLGQYRVVDEEPAAKRVPATVVSKAAPDVVPSKAAETVVPHKTASAPGPSEAAEAVVPHESASAAVPSEAARLATSSKSAAATVAKEAMATPAANPPARSEGRSLSAGEEPAPSAKQAAAASPTTAASTKAPPSENYTIAAGDTLSSIAAKLYQDPRQWRSIAKANPGLELRRLHPGQVIQLPRLQAASP